MRSTGPVDKIERDNWNADANRRTKHWLIWTLLLLVVAYFLPLRWAAILALFYARLADPDLNLRDLPFAFPLPFLFRPPRRNAIYATSVVLKDEASGNTRARLHVLDDGQPALSLYGESGEETFAFTSSSDTHRVETVGQLESETRSLERRLASLETGHRELKEINENFHELQSRLEQLEEARERESDERNEKISSHSFELLDEEGKTRARLQISSDNQPYLALYDGNDLNRASLSLMDNGYPELFLTNLHEGFPSPSEGGNVRGRMILGFDEDGYPQLVMYDDPDPKVGSVDPSISLKIWEAEHSKGAGLSLHVFGRHDEKFEFFGARVVEPASGDSA